MMQTIKIRIKGFLSVPFEKELQMDEAGLAALLKKINSRRMVEPEHLEDVAQQLQIRGPVDAIHELQMKAVTEFDIDLKTREVPTVHIGCA